MNKKKITSIFFSMRTALILLGLLVAACVAGSVIPQQEITAYYTGYYPERVGMLILLLGLDDVFHCWWFIVLTAFLCLNLLGCNMIHFPGLVRQMKQGFSLDRCLNSGAKKCDAVMEGEPEALFQALGFHSIQSETRGGRGYRYAIRNKIGIWGAWLTHLGMLIIILGFSLGQMYTVKYTVYGVPGTVHSVPEEDLTVIIDDFHVNLREDETVEQYTSTLTVEKGKSGDAVTGTASVNHPMNALGMKFYQNSTGWAARVMVFKGEEALQDQVLCVGEQVHVAGIDDLVLSFRAFYPDLAYNESGMPVTASSQLRHPGYLYALYYQEGVLGMNVLEDGSKITIDDYSIIFREPQSYTLIQIKHDPYTWLAGIGGIIICIALLLAFYVRTEELWAVQQPDDSWQVFGKSRKSGILFKESIAEKAEQLKKE